MSSWNDPELLKLFKQQIPLIDVRAPIEFQDGSLPFSVNLPILNNEERALVGTCYKEQGQAAAIELGHQLVGGAIKKSRVQAWSEFIHQNPQAEVFCFRGGLRSRTACQWLAETGLSKKPIEGGYKRMRSFFLSWLNDAPLPEMIKIGGPTGSAKSEFILKFTNIDLEQIAHHRGSAFGYMGPQPSQITFENKLALELIRLSGQKILVEDESATIGKIVLPRRLFSHMQESPMVILKVDQEQRIKNIFHLYVQVQALPFFLASLEKIQKALGGVNYQLVKVSMEKAFAEGKKLEQHQEWIRLLLDLYYDPHYSRGLERQSGKIVFSGNEPEVTTYLKQHGIL